ncbi:MAG: 50S ribosomal protein L14 [Candidatus Wolfebacteria bacterium GW2011_GWC1_43_10]|uniref:Large ribosomal subunit protein uL14 n=2 Tax=Candidatus Wolfeibacteriota TaxID=1752735 RepID=A0A0G1F4H7_9BACT|nr:MAG: 50S ribosomal protein L14 [Candidatus Wolfebacteria bacterium GW2011_GWC1_43_10]KKT22966.1 MAG: 50S ribosomal protein L14 [Parcubacteria group bacterium GW2011_GWB1_43_8b]OGM89918.1 MAG: 50S ribosomal protein L14 [Candidatus Wolfebacteria bacterium GWA1_42_9]
MIQERSILKVADNSGARIIRCFRILGGTKRHYAQIGDVVIASVQVAEPRKPIVKKDKVRAVIVRQKRVFRRKDGSYVRFDENAAVIVDNKKEPRSTRIFGPIPREIKEKGFEKIFTMAQEIV